MTFLFDIGNVLIGVNFELFYEKAFGKSSLTEEEAQAFIAVRDLNDAGRISSDEFVSKSLELLPGNLGKEQFVSAWNGIFFDIEPMWEIVRSLKEEGHRLILFSNTNKLHMDDLLERYPILHEFDERHFSYEIDAIKPNSGFYTQAIENFDLDPEETFYFDDLLENIEAGESFGFQCHQYDASEHEAALEWLDESLV